MKMKRIIIDQKKCIGCGMCTIVVPNVFNLGEDRKSKVIGQNKKQVKNIDKAISACPVGAISYKKD